MLPLAGSAILYKLSYVGFNDEHLNISGKNVAEVATKYHLSLSSS